MDHQIVQFANYLEQWAKSSAHPDSDVLKWYSGELRVPHPEWGVADTVYQSLIRIVNPLEVRKTLISGVAVAVGKLAEKKQWNVVDQMAAHELLKSCIDFAPNPDIQTAVQKMLAHERNNDDPLIINAIRQALIYNQDDDGLKDLWHSLLKGKKMGCITPAPLSDIKGACRLGYLGKPDWISIREAIRLYSEMFANSRERRSIMRALWKDLAQAWGKELFDSTWNWEIINQGMATNWTEWVFETIPCLTGRVPGSDQDVYLWELSARAFKDLLIIKDDLGGLPVKVTKWRNLTKEKLRKAQEVLLRMDRARFRFSYYSSKGLEGIVFDEAARLSATLGDDDTIMDNGWRRVPSNKERWDCATKVLCEAL